ISDSDRHPSLDYLATIHHGIDTEAFSLHPAPGGYLLFFGRIHPDKGTVEAIEVAERAGMRLTIAGIIQDQRYFDEEVAPRIDGDRVRFLGTVGPAERVELLGGAHALLHLISFEEPFGYSVVEAMACGTPVIAFRRGSMPELIDDGSSGFLVAPGDIDRAAAAVGQVGELDRKAARAHVARHFSAERMVDDYLHLYLRLLGREVE